MTSLASVIPIVGIVERHPYVAEVGAETSVHPTGDGRAGRVAVRVPFHAIPQASRPRGDAIDEHPRGGGPDERDRRTVASWTSKFLCRGGRARSGTLLLRTSTRLGGPSDPVAGVPAEIVDLEHGVGPGVPIVTDLPADFELRDGSAEVRRAWSYRVGELPAHLLDVRFDAFLRSHGLAEHDRPEVLVLRASVRRRASKSAAVAPDIGWRLRTALIRRPGFVPVAGEAPVVVGRDGLRVAAGPYDPQRARRGWDRVDVDLPIEPDTGAAIGAIEIPLDRPAATIGEARVQGRMDFEPAGLKGQTISGMRADFIDGLGRWVDDRTMAGLRGPDDGCRVRSIVEVRFDVSLSALAALRVFPVTRRLVLDRVGPSPAVLLAILDAARTIGMQFDDADMRWTVSNDPLDGRAGFPPDKVFASIPVGGWLDVDTAVRWRVKGSSPRSVRVRVRFATPDSTMFGPLIPMAPPDGSPSSDGASAAPASRPPAPSGRTEPRVTVRLDAEHDAPEVVQAAFGRIDRRVRERVS